MEMRTRHLCIFIFLVIFYEFTLHIALSDYSIHFKVIDAFLLTMGLWLILFIAFVYVPKDNTKDCEGKKIQFEFSGGCALCWPLQICEVIFRQPFT